MRCVTLFELVSCVAFQLELLPLDDSDAAVEAVLFNKVLFNKINGDKRRAEGVLAVPLLLSIGVCVVLVSLFGTA